MNKLFTLLLLLLTLPLFGQDRCGTDVLFEQQLKDPKFKRSYFRLEKIAQKAEESKRALAMPDLPITVPVIVHVIHFGEPYGEENHLTIEYVQETFDDLNQNFAGEFSDDPTSNTQINFCIANASTTGEAIEGIRYYDWDDLGLGDWTSSVVYDNNTALSDLLGYDKNNYCNVFVAPFNSPLGFAYLPSSNYGVFVGTDFFGVTNNGSYGLNKTLVHEMGHYCGLYHTFHITQDCGVESNCNSQGDRVCDTPVTTGNFGCPTNGGACGNDLVENFMDYTNDGCMESFTQGQSLRMLSQLEVFRPGVVNNTLACGAIEGIDASINGLTVSNIGCSTVKDIIFNLQSFGDTLTEAIINYSINGISNSITWSGNLGFGESETIVISNINIDYGIADIEVSVDVPEDIYEINDISTLQIDNYEGTLVDIVIEFDDLPFGFSWELFEADINGTPIGEPIDEGGDYTNGVYSCETEINTYCLEEGNYVLVLEDLFGNGMFYPCGGPISIIEGNDTLNTITGNWGSDENLPFYIGPPDPCPPSDCPWDVDGNGFVWVSDILIILQSYGLEVECSPLDINQDGVIGTDDILDALANFDIECGTGITTPPEDSFRRLIQEAGEDVVSVKLYNLQGQEVTYPPTTYLDTGIYMLVEEWTGGFIIRKKIYHQKGE
jgi:hypothetical protein